MYDYETNELPPRRVRTRTITNEERNGMDEEKQSIEKEENNDSNEPLKKQVKNQEGEVNNSEELIVNGVDNTNEDSQEGKFFVFVYLSVNMFTNFIAKNSRVTRKQEMEKNKKVEQGLDSESEPEIRRPPKRRRPNLNYMDDPRFSPMKTKNRKLSGISSNLLKIYKFLKDLIVNN